MTYFLLRRRRVVRAWELRLSSATDEVAWFARDLLPQLRRTGSGAGVVAGWSVGAARVAALDDELSSLVATAPAPDRADRATLLRDAVRSARGRIDSVTPDAADWQASLDAAQEPLLAALVPPAPPRSSPGDVTGGS